jgi:hypothetical protein
LHIPNKEDKAMNKEFTAELMRRSEAAHIPSGTAKAVSTEVTKWTEKSGLEWTIKRLKALKVDFIRATAGLEPSSDWIKYRNGVPHGAFGSLFRMGIRDPRRIGSILQILSMYTFWVGSDTTPSQREKFYGSVATDPLEQSVVDEFYTSLGIQHVAEKLHVRKKRLKTVKDYVPSSSRRCPTVKGRTIVEEPPETDLISPGQKERGWLDTINVLWDTSLGRLLYRRYPQLQEVVRPVEDSVKRKLSKLPPYFYEEGRSADIRREGFVGKIGEIQEPGLKLRAVANPFRVYQLALSRLGAQLYELLETLSWDVTHDQESGVAWAQRKLREGNTMHAVDLSDATNVFPLNLQIKLLRDIRGILEEDINLFETLSMSPWLTNSGELITWTKGQPLGLYPSFAAFALTHGVLVRSLEIELGLSEGDNFRILGDDIVISDSNLARRYREVLQVLQVPVSESKTLSSDRVTEFGGRVIYPDAVIATGKWREISDRSFIDVVRNTGFGYIKFLQPRQRKVILEIATLPPPLGLGINPLGLPLEERLAIEEEFLENVSIDLPEYQKSQWARTYLTSTLASPLDSSLSLHGYLHARPTISARQGRTVSQDLLVRLSQTTGVDIEPSTQLEGLTTSYPDMLERIHMIARELGLVTQSGGDPRGSTTLEILERRLARAKSKVSTVTQPL